MKNKKNQPSCSVKTSIGGQALIEGIMMRGPQKSAMAVRNPDGEIVLEVWENKISKRPKILKLPIIRGVFNFIDSMASGYKSLMRSAEISGLEELEKATDDSSESTENTVISEEAIAEDDTKQEEEATLCEEAKSEETAEMKPQGKEKTDSEAKSSSKLMSLIMVIASVLGVALALVLFIWLPSFLYNLLIERFLTVESLVWRSVIKSAFEGFLKIAILVAYMSLVSLMKDIKRTFMYHGAEHKTIFCYEHGMELTVENVRREGRFHPRCGTSFLILMLLVGMFISFLIDPLFLLISGSELSNVWIRVLIKIILLPLIMGIGYELIKLAGKHQNLFTKIISAPGMWLQRLTVKEPDDSMIECALAAFIEVIPNDGSDKI